MSPTAGTDDGVANHNVIFINTSLDTHLAMIVLESDTVCDFKKKIVLEHRRLFPDTGDVKIESLKVKQRGNFYHLSDTMLVKWAFDASKRNWFLLADVSRLEQSDGVQHLGNHKAGDQLALPWVTHSRSIEIHDDHGSPLVNSKMVPFLNQKVLNGDQHTSGDSCKEASKNAVENKLHTVTTDIKSKKRTHDVHNVSSPKDAFGLGPSVKKKRKTQRVKSDVKASQENIVSTDVNNKVNDKGASINNENSIEHKSKGKESSDENNRTNKGENCSAINQVASEVPSIEGVGSENVGDLAMVVRNSSQQEMSTGLSQKEKDNELLRKPATEDEINSSLMRTTDSKHDAAGVIAGGHLKRSTRLKAAEKELFSTNFIKKFHNTNKDAIESSSQQDVESNNQECADDQIDKYNEDSGVSRKQRPELKLPGRKKGTMGCENTGEGKRRKMKKVFRHVDNLVGDFSSTVPALVTDERKTNGDSEKILLDADSLVCDDVIGKGMEISVENMEEISRKEFKDANDITTLVKEENILPHSESLMNNGAEMSTIRNDTSQVNAPGILDNLEKQNEKTNDTTKKKTKKKTKKSSGRNEDSSITKHVNGGIFENVKEGEGCLPDAARKDGDMSLTVPASVIGERKMEKVSEITLIDAKRGDDVIVKEVEVSVENMEENSRKEFTDTNGLTFSLMNNDAEITTGKNISQVHTQRISENSEKQNEMDDTTKKKRKTKSPSITNIDNIKPPKRTKKIDAQRTTKQQSNVGQTQVKTAKKKSVNSSQPVKSLLNTPGTIFGDDSDDNATVDSDSSTRTPSRNLSSSSGESASSMDSRRKRSHARKGQEDAGKKNRNSQSKPKKISLAERLRTLSNFKKLKATASSSCLEDSESQPVESVPESQLMGK